MKVRFEKWEGLGNDFIVLRRDDLDPVEVARLCDRRRGIGADGVLLVSERAGRPRMIVRNADGSRPEMCGNGLRCVAASVVGPRGALNVGRDSAFAGRSLVVDTDAGERRCEVTRPEGEEASFHVTIAMGVARRGDDLRASIEGRDHRFLTVDMGNPHAVTFEGASEAELSRVGPVVTAIPPGGTNVELCSVERRDHIRVVVWERGVGPTLACGTGACAVAAAACDEGLTAFGEPVTVELPGGALTITVDRATRAVTMTGPARCVFQGEVELS